MALSSAVDQAEPAFESISHENAKQRFNFYNYLIILAVSCGTLATGMSNGVIGTTLGQPSFLNYFGFLQFTATNTPLIGAITGVFFAGAMFGCAFASYCNNRFGRKRALLIANTINLVGIALVAASVHIAMLLVFRTLSGFASGMMISVTSVLQSELAPPHFRGLMVGVTGIMISCGYLIVNWLGLAFYFVEAGGAQWRVPIAICVFPNIVLYVLFAFPVIPESPRWLVNRGRRDEAKAVLVQLHGRNHADAEQFANIELQQIHEQIEFEKQHIQPWHAMFLKRKYWRRTVLTAVTMFMSQSCGIIVIVSYGPAIYSSLGFNTVGQLAITAGYVTWSTLCAMVGTLIIDKVGRVRLMIIGTIVQIVLIAVVAALVARFAESTNKSALAATVAMFYIFASGFCLFVEGPAYTYICEIWPMHMRAQGTAVGIASIYLIDIAFVEASLYAFAIIGWRYYLVFVVCGTFFLIVFWALAKETKNLSLEEIGVLFGEPLGTETLDNLIHHQNEKSTGAHYELVAQGGVAAKEAPKDQSH